MSGDAGELNLARLPASVRFDDVAAVLAYARPQ
jgi:hypothetical protein